MTGRLSPDGKGGGSFTLGIYGSEALRARVHNDGLGKMPQRKFVGVSPADKEAIKADLLNAVNGRLKAA